MHNKQNEILIKTAPWLLKNVLYKKGYEKGIHLNYIDKLLTLIQKNLKIQRFYLTEAEFSSKMLTRKNRTQKKDISDLFQFFVYMGYLKKKNSRNKYYIKIRICDITNEKI